jgi:hypothetical protein
VRCAAVGPPPCEAAIDPVTGLPSLPPVLDPVTGQPFTAVLRNNVMFAGPQTLYFDSSGTPQWPQGTTARSYTLSYPPPLDKLKCVSVAASTGFVSVAEQSACLVP